MKAVNRLKNPVSLYQIKKEKKLKNIALIKQSRLSVMELKKGMGHNIKNVRIVWTNKFFG